MSFTSERSVTKFIESTLSAGEMKFIFFKTSETLKFFVSLKTNTGYNQAKIHAWIPPVSRHYTQAQIPY